MDIQTRLEAFWAGEKPDKIPYTIYQNEWRHTQNDPAWIPMFEAGLGVVYHVPSYKIVQKDVDWKREAYREKGQNYVRTMAATPRGSIYMVEREGWTQKYWLETKADYQVMTDIVNRTQVLPDYEAFRGKEKEIRPYGIPLIAGGRTPLQTILVDYVGLENFAYHLVDLADEIDRLYHALLAQFGQKAEIMAAGPGRFVSILENFTAETLGPARFGHYLVPVYEKYFPLLQSSGKIVGTHYDGKLASCQDLIAAAPIDVIESLTPPPEGDLELKQCRAVWPEKLFWSNINVANYYLPPHQLKEVVVDLVKQAAPDGRRLAFEVSEQYPENWKESIPIVLEVLNEDI